MLSEKESWNMGGQSRRPKVRTRTDAQRKADDAALLATGEPLAPLAELAVMLGVSTNMLRWVIQRNGAPLVRYLSSSRPVQHCIAEARAAVEAARPEIEARRKRADELEAAQRALADAHDAEDAAVLAAKAPPNARPAAPAGAPREVTRSRVLVPEVVIVRRRSL